MKLDLPVDMINTICRALQTQAEQTTVALDAISFQADEQMKAERETAEAAKVPKKGK
ncbi:hypothetical protein UFOVP1339_56 [uncultured Caudovirales phage]|uniref:Uncharacterized protein n=1 Tax=uncultured Caudovirales phage TaxID=2100421 RepID=A0A6J5S256_9CAUD|nr:hypothetical protein UFOVP1339_56 [uncultured Caudovirales phage]